MHQHPRRSIPERQRGGSASVPVWTLPHPGGYSCKYSDKFLIFKVGEGTVAHTEPTNFATNGQ